MAKLRRLSPDPALFRRRAAGEPLRELARDYGVSHTSLSRYFARPQAAKELKRAAQLNRAEERAEEARWRAEQRAARESRRKRTAAKAAGAERASARLPAAVKPPERASPSERERGREGGAAGVSAAAPPAARRKKLRARASAEARGLVRLANPEGTLTTWVEAVKVPALLEAGWTHA